MSDTPTDPREMRKAMQAAVYRGERVDGTGRSRGSMSVAAVLARNVMQSAEIQGFSGEDTMTAVAYYALCELERMNDRLLEQLYLMPAPKMVVKRDAPTPEQFRAAMVDEGWPAPKEDAALRNEGEE